MELEIVDDGRGAGGKAARAATASPACASAWRCTAECSRAGPSTGGGFRVRARLPDMSLRVLIADDQALVRTGFRKILESEPDIDVVGEAQDGGEAIERARLLRPDVVLMDIRMPRRGRDRGHAPHSPADARVLILTTFDVDEYVYEALRAGASGFLLKDTQADQLVTGVRVVAQGESLLAPSITRRLIEQFARRPPPSARPAGSRS